MRAKFNDIRHFKASTARPLTLAKRLRLIEKHLTPGPRRFLDCGCGIGNYVQALIEQLGVDACGIEYDQETVTLAQLNPVLQGRVTQGDLQAIKSEDNQWDYAMLNEVLEHVGDDRRVLAEVHRILKPRGILFVFSPNRWFPFETHSVDWKKSRRRIPNWVPFIPYLPVRVGERFLFYWARNYWPRELAGKVMAAGFSIIERNYVWLTFENISGYQPPLIGMIKPTLRFASNCLEKIPFLRRFGTSQVLICGKEA
ncbi:MAG: methyltransferase domain-containing protein [Limisphaerales bacterium]